MEYKCLFCGRAVNGNSWMCEADRMAVSRAIKSGLSPKYRLSEELAVSLMFILENLSFLRKLDTLDESNIAEIILNLKAFRDLVSHQGGMKQALKCIEVWVGPIEVAVE